MSLSSIENALGVTFADKALLQLALTHRSACAKDALKSNERLEFLGDALLGAITAQALFERFPTLPEGELTKLRAQLVRGKNLSAVAKRLGMQSHLRHNLKKPSPQAIDNLLEQSLEALIGALFLDKGFEETKERVLEWIAIDTAGKASPGEAVIFNPKGKLQELLKSQGNREEIEYRTVSETGKQHEKIFTVELCIKGRLVSTGVGPSKKAAEELAAANALKEIKTN